MQRNFWCLDPCFFLILFHIFHFPFLSFLFLFLIRCASFYATLWQLFESKIFHYDLTLRCLIALRDFYANAQVEQTVRIYIYTYILLCAIYVCISSKSIAGWKFCNCLAASLGWVGRVTDFKLAGRGLRGIFSNVKHKLTNCRDDWRTEGGLKFRSSWWSSQALKRWTGNATRHCT